VEEEQTTKRRLTAAVQRQTQKVGVCDPRIAATFSNPKSFNNSLWFTLSVFPKDVPPSRSTTANFPENAKQRKYNASGSSWPGS